MQNKSKRPLRMESLETRRLLASHPLQTDVLLLQRADSDQNWYAGGTPESVSSQDDPGGEWTPIVSGDFTSDGVTDLLGIESGEWWLQINDGSQLMGRSWGDSPANAEMLGTGDFNDDGWLDVLSRDVATGDFLLSRNSADGFTVERWGGWTTAVTWSNVTIRDFDHDGLLDVLGSEPGGNWWLAKNHGSGFHNHHWGKYQQFDWQDIVAGDFNGDQFVDMAARAPDHTWRIWNGSDAGFAVPEYSGHWKIRDHWQDVMAADFDGDGRDDLIGRSDDGLLWVGSSTDTGLQTRVWATGWIASAEWSDVKLMDVDGDDKIDQIGHAQDGTFWVAKNTGTKLQNYFWGRSAVAASFVDYVADFRTPTTVDVSRFFADNQDVTSQGIPTPPQPQPQVPVGDAEYFSDTAQGNDLHISLNDDNFIVVTATSDEGVRVAGLDLHSRSGSLVPLPDKTPLAPFSYLLSNTPNQVTLGLLGTPALLVGSLTLDVGWNPDLGARDLFVQYGIGPSPYLATVDAELQS